MVQPVAADDTIASLVTEALRRAGLVAEDRPDLRVVTGDGVRAPRRSAQGGLDGATIVVVVADSSLLGRSPAPDDAIEFRREGDRWEIRGRGHRCSVRHSVGMAQLMTLLRNPGCDIDAVTLAGRERHTCLTIDPLLDPSARAAYRSHVDDLRDDIAEAELDGDLGRVEQLRAELRFVAEHLAAATGLDGRGRNWTDDDERARVAVTKAIRRAISAVAAEDAELGTLLEAAVDTGRVCTFNRLFEARVVG